MRKTTKRPSHISLFAKLSLLLSFVVSNASFAIADEQTLITSTQMKLAAYKVSTRFHQLTLHEGDSLIQEKLEQDISFLSSLRQSLSEDNAPESAEAINESLAISKDYIDFANKNEIATEGFTSRYAITDLHEARFSLLTTLNKVIEKEKEVSGSSKKYDLYKAATLLQQMTSDYVRRSVSTGGAGLYIEGQENMDAPDVLAQKFSDQLKAISQAHKGNKELSSMIRSIDRKWRFIEPSFKNYNEKTVPFLVTKYCDIIVTTLSDVADQI
ncbi:hypothetical protein ACFOEK_21150 [Litoribrevibacter euphylliae]|uniref:NarX-like N-terminal domain-containing protein n=1 Tax=Litoribrevibacter euphylliae TaxID=1834034 RepID=A0ABV7HN40_9GAMM